MSKLDLTTMEGLLEFTGGIKPVHAEAERITSELLAERTGDRFVTPVLDMWRVALYDEDDTNIGELDGFSTVAYDGGPLFGPGRAEARWAVRHRPRPQYRRDRTLVSAAGRTVEFRSWFASPARSVYRDVDPALIPDAEEILAEMLDRAGWNLHDEAQVREEWAKQHRINAAAVGRSERFRAIDLAEAEACLATAADLRSAQPR